MHEGISLDLAIESFNFLFITSLVHKRKLQKMELRWSHIVHLYNVFLENDGSENCAQLLEEEVNKMFGTKYWNDEFDCNVISMNFLNIHDANDMHSHKLGDAMFDEYDIFCPPCFNENIYYDESMPPIYDDYIHESGFGEVMTLFSDESTISEEVPIDYENKVGIYDDYCDDLYAIKNNDNHETCHHDFNFQYLDSYFVEFAPTTIHDNKFSHQNSGDKKYHLHQTWHPQACGFAYH